MKEIKFLSVGYDTERTRGVINRIIYPTPHSTKSIRFAWSDNDIFEYSFCIYDFYGTILNFKSFYQEQWQRMRNHREFYLTLVPCIIDVCGNEWIRLGSNDITLYSTTELLAIRYKIYYR